MNHDATPGLHGTDRGSRDPFGAGPAEVRASEPAGLRPNWLASALAGVYGIGALAVAAWVILDDVEGVVPGLVLWGTVWLLLSAPCACAIAVVGWRAERALGIVRSTRPPNDPGAPLRRAWGWLMFAIGVVTAVHWLAMCPWAFALIGATALDPNDADETLPLAAFALVAWLLAAGGVILAVGGRRLLGVGEGPEGAAGRSPVPASVVPTSAIVGLAYGLSVALPTGLWFTWLGGRWTGGAGFSAVLGWVLLGVSAAALAGGVAGTWLLAAAPIAPWTSVRAGMRQAEVSGAVLTAHWVPTFLLLVMTSVRVENADQHYVVMLLAFGAITLGTAIWSSARTARVQSVPTA